MSIITTRQAILEDTSQVHDIYGRLIGFYPEHDVYSTAEYICNKTVVAIFDSKLIGAVSFCEDISDIVKADIMKAFPSIKSEEFCSGAIGAVEKEFSHQGIGTLLIGEVLKLIPSKYKIMVVEGWSKNEDKAHTTKAVVDNGFSLFRLYKDFWGSAGKGGQSDCLYCSDLNECEKLSCHNFVYYKLL